MILDLQAFYKMDPKDREYKYFSAKFLYELPGILKKFSELPAGDLDAVLAAAYENSIFRNSIALFQNRTRSELFPKAKQTEALKEYNSGVPIFLSAFKRYRNIDYSKWNWSDPRIQYLTGKDIYEVVNADLSMFDEAYIRKVSEHMNTRYKHAHMMYNISSIDLDLDNAFNKLSRVGRFMLLNRWIFAPMYRHKYMVVNPKDIDSEVGMFSTNEIIPEKHVITDTLEPWIP